MKILIFTCTLFFTSFTAKADMAGADVAVLIEILSNAMNQLHQLVSIVKNGQETIDLMHDVNDGVNDILNFQVPNNLSLPHHARQEWLSDLSSLEGVRHLYGTTIMSPVQGFHDSVDASVAKAMHLQSLVSQYSTKTDQIARDIQTHSRNVSPKGAQKLNAQATGVMVGVMNENLRVQTESVRLQAESLALKNREDKKRVEMVIEEQKKLTLAMRTNQVKFETPRF